VPAVPPLEPSGAPPPFDPEEQAEIVKQTKHKARRIPIHRRAASFTELGFVRAASVRQVATLGTGAPKCRLNEG
jgi:hypothetical protein